MDRGNLEFEVDYGATGELMIRMKNPLFGTGKTVLIDSGFSVMKGVVLMLAHGMYGTTVINKKDIGPSTAR